MYAVKYDLRAFCNPEPSYALIFSAAQGSTAQSITINPSTPFNQAYCTTAKAAIVMQSVYLREIQSIMSYDTVETRYNR